MIVSGELGFTGPLFSTSICPAKSAWSSPKSFDPSFFSCLSEFCHFWIAELRSAMPGARKLSESQFCKMARVNRIASNKQKLDMVLLGTPSQFGLVKFGLELSGLVWFGMDVFGFLYLSSVWYG